MNDEIEIKFELRQSVLDALKVAAEEAELGTASYIERVLVTHIREVRFKKDCANFPVVSGPPEPIVHTPHPPRQPAPAPPPERLNGIGQPYKVHYAVKKGEGFCPVASPSAPATPYWEFVTCKKCLGRMEEAEAEGEK